MVNLMIRRYRNIPFRMSQCRRFHSKETESCWLNFGHFICIKHVAVSPFTIQGRWDAGLKVGHLEWTYWSNGLRSSLWSLVLVVSCHPIWIPNDRSISPTSSENNVEAWGHDSLQSCVLDSLIVSHRGIIRCWATEMVRLSGLWLSLLLPMLILFWPASDVDKRLSFEGIWCHHPFKQPSATQRFFCFV